MHGCRPKDTIQKAEKQKVENSLFGSLFFLIEKRLAGDTC